MFLGVFSKICRKIYRINVEILKIHGIISQIYAKNFFNNLYFTV